MKLIVDNRVKLFEDGISVDPNLPKFSTIKKVGDPKNKMDTDPDSIELNSFNNPIHFQITKELSGEIVDLGDIHELLGAGNAHLLNIRMGKILYSKIQNEKWIIREPRENDQSVPKVNFWKRIFKGIAKSERPEDIYELDISDVFKEIKLVSSGKEVFVQRIAEYLSLIEKATRMGQEAQKEKLLSEFTNHLYESILYSVGLCNYVTADKLIELQGKCKRQLNLDYVKNFTRVIPDEVVNRKEEVDRLEIFDNYVILHYDPTNSSVAPTPREIEAEYLRRKDPILFGVILGSNKLYYISDWVDEYCDLTWDEVVKKLGESGVGKIENKIKI